MASAKRLRKRARRAAGREAAAAAKEVGSIRKPAVLPCERCGAGCRTNKPVYGWVCANCAYELDRFVMLRMGMTGGTPWAIYVDAKARRELPPPGPRGPGVNVRKPSTLGLMSTPR